MTAPTTPPAYTALTVSSASLGAHLGGLKDLLQQVQTLVTDQAPGGLQAKRAELTGYISQVQALVDDATGQLEVLTGMTDLLTQFASVLLGSLEAGVTKIEMSGPSATVQAEMGRALAAAAPPGTVTYGVTLIATAPDGAAALASLLGAGQTLAARFGAAAPPATP